MSVIITLRLLKGDKSLQELVKGEMCAFVQLVPEADGVYGLLEERAINAKTEAVLRLVLAKAAATGRIELPEPTEQVAGHMKRYRELFADDLPDLG